MPINEKYGIYVPDQGVRETHYPGYEEPVAPAEPAPEPADEPVKVPEGPPHADPEV